VLQQILALRESGHTLIVTTHDLEKVLGLADRLILMENGRIVRDGDPAAVVKGADAFGVREPEASRRGMALSSWLN
jgi:biotin transport system ATP-binding protein